MNVYLIVLKLHTKTCQFHARSMGAIGIIANYDFKSALYLFYPLQLNFECDKSKMKKLLIKRRFA